MLDDKDEFSRSVLLCLVQNRFVKPEIAKDFLEEVRHVYRFEDVESWLAGVEPDLAEELMLMAVDDIREERENEKCWWLRVGSFVTW